MSFELERATMLLAQARAQAERLRGWWLESEAKLIEYEQVDDGRVWILSRRCGGGPWDVEGVFSDPAKALEHVEYVYDLPKEPEPWSWYRRDLSVHREAGDCGYKIEVMDVWS